MRFLATQDGDIKLAKPFTKLFQLNLEENKMRKYQQLAEEIVKTVGGSENVLDLTHCMTRLRFQLRDGSLPNDEVLKQMDGIVSVMRSGGQYQVVIGNHVSEVYSEVTQLTKVGEKPTAPITDKEIKRRNPLMPLLMSCQTYFSRFWEFCVPQVC